MTYKANGVIIICAEDLDICQECGALAETRPYGVNGKRICFKCGMKNSEETERRMQEFFGENET